ncbi:unnamed protein product, partial [Ectocarpus sp. 4 AP-2014]
ACGRQECGWVTTTPGEPCKLCPRGEHLAGEKLYALCHRPADEEGFTDIVSRLSAAIELCARGTSLLGSVVPVYRPARSHCLCQRENCFHHFVVQGAKTGMKRECDECKQAFPVKGRRWHPAANDKDGGGLRVRLLCVAKPAICGICTGGPR